MAKIFTIDEIKSALNIDEIIRALEEGYVKYSQGDVIVPPVGFLELDNPVGEVHIKYGYIKNDDCYVVKISSYIHDTGKYGLPPGNGLMIVFSKITGAVKGILLDEGYLTELRTALAGAISAKYLAPKKITNIGIVGTGIQARFQLEYLSYVTDYKDVIVWGRTLQNAEKYKDDMSQKGFNIKIAEDLDYLTKNCNLIVTATTSKSPVLLAQNIMKGTHITAMGADTQAKQELDPEILNKADIVVADSISQCIHHGEIHYAVNQGLISKEKVIELGNVVANPELGRKNDEQITITDLTGVAVQDIQIAKMVFKTLGCEK